MQRAEGKAEQPVGGRVGVVETELEQALAALATAHAELIERQSFTNALLETIEVGIVSCDGDGVFLVSNRAERAMFGLDVGLEGLLPEQLGPLIDVFEPDGKRVAVEAYPLMRTLRGEDVPLLEVLVGPAGGPYRDVVVRGSRITSPDGAVLGAVAALTDVTAERTASRALAEESRKLIDARHFLDAVLSATPDYTFVADLATGAIIYGSRDKDIPGTTSAQLETLGPDAISGLVHTDDQLRLRAMTVAVGDLDDGQVLQVRYRGQHPDGQWRWLNRRVTPFRRDAAGEVIEILGVVRDVTDLVQAEDRLTYATLHDDLTGLPNRALLVDRLDAALLRSGRDGLEVAVLFCDLDGFKNVNDTAGHSAGDAVLLEIARRFNSVLRDGDTVARVGGDEFVIVVEPWNRSSLDKNARTQEIAVTTFRALAVEVAGRVAQAMREPISVNGVDHVVTASIGISYADLSRAGHTGRVTADEVLQEADAAMYRAKERGKNRYELFDGPGRTRGQFDGVAIAHRSPEVEPLRAVAAERLQ